MALGSLKIIITLAALAIGATLVDIGIIVAANAVVSIVMSIAWGRLSDYFGLRIRFLLVFFVSSAPMFVLLGLSGAVWQLIALYTALAFFASGVQPVAAMYAVEYREGKNWQKEIVKYNSFLNIGTIFGLVVNTLLAIFIPLSWILFIASGFCISAAIILWLTAKEPELPLEREAYPTVELAEEDSTGHTSVLDYFDIRRIKVHKLLRRLKPLHLLFLACLIHWTGVNAFGVGEVPFMRAIGLSASLILGINVAENVATVFSFSRLGPKVKLAYQRLVPLMMASRAILIGCWAALTVLLTYRVSFAFAFPLALEVLFLICYALLWQPIICFAISQAPFNKKGTTQGQLLAVSSLANVIGSLIGGFLIGTFGYLVGFLVSGAIAVLALPILRYINIEIKSD
jgi:MFS family permease